METAWEQSCSMVDLVARSHSSIGMHSGKHLSLTNRWLFRCFNNEMDSLCRLVETSKSAGIATSA